MKKKRARIILGTMAYIPWALWDQQGLRKKEEAVQADIEKEVKGESLPQTRIQSIHSTFTF